MTPEKLQSIVREVNEETERQAAYKVKQIIIRINDLQYDLQQQKLTCDTEIAELREKLKTYTISQLDETKILGDLCQSQSKASVSPPSPSPLTTKATSASQPATSSSAALTK